MRDFEFGVDTLGLLPGAGFAGFNTSVFGRFAAIYAGAGQTAVVDLLTTSGAEAQARQAAIDVFTIPDPDLLLG